LSLKYHLGKKYSFFFRRQYIILLSFQVFNEVYKYEWYNKKKSKRYGNITSKKGEEGISIYFYRLLKSKPSL
jgi:hypothetical protein